MKIKKYEGSTLGEALRKVREDLGKDALILYTHIPQTKGFFGRFSRQKFMIVAGKGFKVVKAGDPAAADKAARPAPAPLPAVPLPTARPAEGRELEEVKEMVRELQELVRQGDMSQLEDEVLQAYLAMLENDISTILARTLVGRIRKTLDPKDRNNGAIVRQAVRNVVTEMISVTGPIRLTGSGCRKIALIGPTGVGKTTTIAKLAANFALKEHRRVGLLTLDTYRIAATDQLRKIAEIMDVPLAVVANARELTRALAEFADRDVVLIDTAGRSQNDDGRLQELRMMMETAQPDEVHLVASATSRVDHLLDVVNKFAAVRVDRIILSKIDEASKFGLILDVLARVRKGISYLTTGQKIPQDIEPASVPRLAGLILGDEARVEAGAAAGSVR